MFAEVHEEVAGLLGGPLGVVVGGTMANRSQRQQWVRDKQVDACTAVIEESTRMQIALRHFWSQGQQADWTAWN